MMQLFQKRGFFLTSLVAFCVLGIVAVMLAGCASSPKESKNQDVDPEYEYAVIDTEPADDVRKRAEEVAGDRFVELWISPDQKSYVIGVYKLEESEKASLTKAIQKTAPIELVSRDFSRSELTELGENTQKALKKHDITVSSFALDYEMGAVLVGLPSDDFSVVMSQLDGEKELRGKVCLGDDIGLSQNDAARLQSDEAKVVLVHTEIVEE